jgi:methionyl aminopeptidase
MGLFSSGQEGKRVFYKTDDEIAQIRESCLLVSKTLAHVASLLKPGITGREIDAAAETFIRDHNARPAFKGYGQDQDNLFPGSLCVSINDVVVHGFPSDQPFTETDVVSVDCGVELNGFYGDAAFTFAFADVEEKTMNLLSVTYTSLYKAIEQAVVGKRLGDIAFAVQEYCERRFKYGIVRELVGHGLGRSLHEDPEVPNYGKRGQGMLMRDGLVIAIEPMVNMGTKEVFQAGDGWTIRTKDGKASAHFEHTVAVRKNKADILSNHKFIVDAIKNNENLQEVSLKS